jgi:hypothetical protein
MLSKPWLAKALYYTLVVSIQNDVSEKEQRWGAKTVEGSGHVESIKYEPNPMYSMIRDVRQSYIVN